MNKLFLINTNICWYSVWKNLLNHNETYAEIYVSWNFFNPMSINVTGISGCSLLFAKNVILAANFKFKKKQSSISLYLYYGWNVECVFGKEA